MSEPCAACKHGSKPRARGVTEAINHSDDALGPEIHNRRIDWAQRLGHCCHIVLEPRAGLNCLGSTAVVDLVERWRVEFFFGNLFILELREKCLAPSLLGDFPAILISSTRPPGVQRQIATFQKRIKILEGHC